MLYARFGNDDTYHQFDNLTQFNGELVRRKIDGLYDRVNEYGITAPGYEGQNYISVYYGSDVETPTHGLSDVELKKLNDLFINRWANGIEKEVGLFADNVLEDIDMAGPENIQ